MLSHYRGCRNAGFYSIHFPRTSRLLEYRWTFFFSPDELVCFSPSDESMDHSTRLFIYYASTEYFPPKAWKYF